MKAQLLVDIGNSRLKWTLRHGRRRSAQQAVPHGNDSTVGLRGALGRAARRADIVLVVSVAKPAFTRALLGLWRREGLKIRVLRSRSKQLGLRNAYVEPWRLGADRWVSMLGARAITRRPRSLLVIGAGTALTADLIDRQGRHRGGVIVPGLQLMQASLLARTAGIARRAGAGRLAAGYARAGTGKRHWARDTAGALAIGAREACAGLIERLRVEAKRELGHYPQVVLAGGDAPALAGHLKCPYRHVPDLVLRGLAAVGE